MKRQASEKPGFVYVAYCADCSKVGYTGDPYKRFLSHRAIWGGEIGFSHVFEFPTKHEARRVETCVHRKLKDKSVAGWEFYRMTNSAVINVIKECAGAELVRRDPHEFHKRPEAFTPAPLRDGDVSANN